MKVGRLVPQNRIIHPFRHYDIPLRDRVLVIPVRLTTDYWLLSYPQPVIP